MKIGNKIKELMSAGHSQEQAVAISEKVAKDEIDAPRYFGEQISENMIKTPEGYLICLDVVIATSAPMEYNNEDIGLDTNNNIVIITNPWEELSAPSTIASFEAKPVTAGHPEEKLLNSDTATFETVGLCVNVRADNENKYLVADLVIIANEAIRIIENGIKEVSCGYSAISVFDNGDGTGYRIGIIGNHVAIVPNGRCGEQCSISDTKGNSKMDKKTIIETLKSWVTDSEDETVFDAKAAYDALTKDIADMKAMIAKDAELVPTEAPADGDNKLDQVLALLNKLLDAESAEDDDVIDKKDVATDAADVIKITTIATDSDESVMTPSKLNAMASQFYKKG
jgi:hypothetical protein